MVSLVFLAPLFVALAAEAGGQAMQAPPGVGALAGLAGGLAAVALLHRSHRESGEST